MKQKYSIRHGFVDPPFLELHELNGRLRSRLWGTLQQLLELLYEDHPEFGRWSDPAEYALWEDHFALAPDAFPSWRDGHDMVAHVVLNKPAPDVFEIVEILLELNGPSSYVRGGQASTVLNHIFEREGSVHRVVGGEVIASIEPAEIAEVEAALSKAAAVKRHLKAALEQMKGSAPNYAGSMNQSIIAVESALNVIGGTGLSLGKALSSISNRLPMHGAFRAALESLYGFTSDAVGIRHGKTGEPLDATFRNARFMLVTCSAFINYLLDANLIKPESADDAVQS